MVGARFRDFAVVAALTSVAILSCGSEPVEAGAAADGGAEGPGTEGGATHGEGGTRPASTCRTAAAVKAISACIDGGASPRACLAQVRPPGGEACDVDDDGLDDTLEDAMLRSYAPVIAFNKAGGDRTAGDSEPNFPDNARHYVANSKLYWRVDGDDDTKKVVDAKPTLEALSKARFTFGGTERSADKTALGHGPNFWLCLDTTDGKYSSDAVVGSMDISRKLAGGIDVFGVVHPSGSDQRAGRYVVVQYMVFFAYNTFTLDDHEGDFEGGAVFVDMETGKVAALYTDRHPTADGATLVPLEGPGKLPAKDPDGEAPHYNICSDTNTSAVGGVRFWDHEGKRHHPVLYMAAGGHASYAYPGATKIKGAGCTELTMIRDVHNGQGPKLALHEDAYFTDWGKTKLPVEHGVHFVNLGERAKLRAAWSAFAGQWGCTLSAIPKSYPGPWDNERLCRHWLTDDWGAAPPFAREPAGGCAP